MGDRVFIPTADQNWITIFRGTQRDNGLRLTPAEVGRAAQLVGLALGMETMEVLPDHISNKPFVIRFFEDNKLALERADLKGSIPFAWDEADDLILALKDGLKIAINERVLVKGARGTGFNPQVEEPFI